MLRTQGTLDAQAVFNDVTMAGKCSECLQFLLSTSRFDVTF